MNDNPGTGKPPSLADALDFDRAIGLFAAARLLRGRGGKAPSVAPLRRWANPGHGCYPQGKEGPRLVLMTARLNGELLTWPEWVEAFERERVRLGVR